MTTPAPTIPKFHIKREAPPVADELSDDEDEAPSPPRQKSSQNYAFEQSLQHYKRKAEPVKTEVGAKKSKKEASDKKAKASNTIDMADLVRSNEALKRSNDEVVRSNKAVIAANENTVRANEALGKELRKATTTINSALEVVSAVWQQYQTLLERDIFLRQQEMRRRGRDSDDDDEYNDDIPRISV
ncbi:hypothetical protein, variant [Saprolegnia diclina VS20]|uniref:Uncharacterized protein n=1 Tax=Saprolegnia diclina (strain VS20) TaxID=1156394 RepID=T0QTT7_SAPDV|nr:hypothetical protein, variant [Saprolegnia diclina VS20]EQC41584.1 hypothetical protein, variant [Saprolegnia diclina VS20]|eukprot:XP_008605298.1 hypothetical protein, variant [Saprolegnia diclina VS20]